MLNAVIVSFELYFERINAIFEQKWKISWFIFKVRPYSRVNDVAVSKDLEHRT